MVLSDHPSVEVRREGRVAYVWLNRPDKLNALDTDTLVAVAEVFESFASDFDVRVAVLGGRGRAFSAGADQIGRAHV